VRFSLTANGRQVKEVKIYFMNWEERKQEALNRAENKLKWSPKRLKMFRLLGGWSQNEFSQLLGIHQSTLVNYEKDRILSDSKVIDRLNVFASEFKKNRIGELIKEIEFLETF
jgi:DNA-binding XRE family transcriptional regulator